MKLNTLRTLFVLFLAVPLAMPRHAMGQTSVLQTPAAGAPASAPATPSATRTVSLSASNVKLGDALAEIAAQADLRLVYGSDIVPVDRTVSVDFEGVSVAQALRHLLAGTDVDFEFAGRQQVILKRRPTPPPATSKPATGAVRGRVTDAATGQGVPAVNVWLEGTRWGTVTNDAGNYLIVGVEPGTYTIRTGRIGYRDAVNTITVADGETVTVDFAVEPAPTQLDAIVATVTGDQRVREMGHVVTRIQVDSLVRAAPISNISELLTGRVPGLVVLPTSGTVGGEVNLRMRAAVSENLSADPIVIVDGIRYSSGTDYDGLTVGGFNVEPTSRLNDLNPNDIESIEVVKGPSAAALYGTDAANGVIVIRTKRGQAGPARWNAYVRAGISTMADYEHPDAWWGWGGSPSLSCTLYRMGQGQCTQDSVQVIPNPLNDPDLSIFAPKPRMQYGANVSGGREGFSYYFSADYEDATGPIHLPAAMVDELREQLGGGEPLESQLEPNHLGKLNLRANVVANVTDNATVRVDVGYTQSETRQMAFGNPYTSAYALRPGDEPYGTGLASPIGNFSRSSTEWLNRFTGSALVEWKPVEWLQTRALLGMDMPNTHRYSLGMRDAYEGYTGEATEDRYRALNTTAEFGATASFLFGDISSRTSVGTQYYRRYGNRLIARGQNLRPGGTAVIDAASTTITQSYRETVTLGSYFEQIFGIKDRLFLSGALRVDGASSFGHDFQAAVYPKASVSWVISEEPFMPRIDWLGNVRLRYAFGASGQQPNPDMRDFEFISGQMLYGGSTTNRIAVSRLPAPELRPERIREHEFGIDVSAFDERVNLDLTWSRRGITDQIRSVTLPQGLGTTWTNVGYSSGKAFEAVASARIIDSRPLTFDLRATHATSSTLLEDLGGMPVKYAVDGSMVEGFPLGARFMREIVSYEDTNGNGYLDLDEVVMSDTAVYIGVGTPGKSQTLTAILGLFDQRVRVSAMFEHKGDYMQYNYLAMRQRMNGTARAAVDPTAPLEDQAKIIATYHYGTTAQPATGYFEIEPGDHTRLRELAVAVALPDRWAQMAGLRNATLSVSGRNLFMWSDYNGADPEVGRFNNNFGTYSDNIPQARNWVVRLDVGF